MMLRPQVPRLRLPRLTLSRPLVKPTPFLRLAPLSKLA
jgi:hypothetical protein